MGCCLYTLMSRIFLIFVYLFTNWYSGFENSLIAFLGWLFAPLTSLAWIYVSLNNDGNIEGHYIFVFLLAVVLDFSNLVCLWDE